MSVIDSKKNRDAALIKNYKGPCPYCNYQLKNPENSRCPECGSRLSFRLVAPFRFTPWHAMIISFVISIGACLDRTFLSVVGIFNSNSGIVALEMFVGSALGLIIVGFGLCVVWRHRSWFVGIPAWRRAMWYLVASLIPIVVTVVQYFVLTYFILQGF
jgi:hypothetical protein